MNPIDEKLLEFIEQLKLKGKIRFDADFCRDMRYDLDTNELLSLNLQNRNK